MSNKLRVSRWIFDAAISDVIDLIPHDEMVDYYEHVRATLDIRTKAQEGGEMETVYLDFGGDLSSAREYATLRGIPRKQVVLARDVRQLEGRRCRIMPVNLERPWSLLNWNHDIHMRARDAVYLSESLYGSAR